MGMAKIRFSGHQTFCFRYGWLEKGFRFVAKEKSFSDENAIVELGVGKNMVDSIKYWCEMTGVIKDGAITEIGKRLLDEDTGWDPYLEDHASWWLLHWQMATNPDFRTAGEALFSYLRKPEFSKQDVAEAALKLVEEGKKPPADKVIMRDVDCYIRAYSGLRRFDKQLLKEEGFECPWQDLNLVQPMSEGELYRFTIGAKVSLPPAVIGYALSEYLGRENKPSTTLQKALYSEHSPGQVFMLDENALIEALQTLHEDRKWGAHFDFTESAGRANAIGSLSPDEATEFLSDYYRGALA